jgi:transcription elongation factor SPT4
MVFDEEDEDEEEEDDDDEGDKNNQAGKSANPFAYMAQTPNSMKGLVACRACALVKTFDQFYDDDCDNCDIMGGEDRNSRIRVTTTPHFDGLCGIYQPEQSWAARWQGFNSLKPGLYALKVLEELPADIKAELDQSKTPYLKEDVSTRQDEDFNL